MDRLPDRLTTPRLTLRLWQASDTAALSAAVTASAEHLRPWMAWMADEPLGYDERVALIEQWRRDWEGGGDAILGMFADDVVVGSTGFHRRGAPSSLEIGYWVHVAHVRQGYATEAAMALTTAAFELPDIEQVEIHHAEGNVASAGVPRALGYDEVAPCTWAVTRRAWRASAER